MTAQPPFIGPEGPQIARTFEVPSTQQWRAAAEALLKGRPLASLDKVKAGVTVHPLYGPDDALAEGSRVLPSRQGPWDVRAQLDAGTVGQLASGARVAIAGGATSLWIDTGATGLVPSDLGRVLDGVDLASVGVDVDVEGDETAWLEAVVAVADVAGVGRDAIFGAVASDPLGRVAAGGDPSQVARAGEIVRLALETADRLGTPGLSTVGVSTLPYAEAGADAVTELAALLGTGAELLRGLDAQGIAPSHWAASVQLRVSVGAETFVEIAKLRAARQLWARLLAAAGVVAPPVTLHGVVSRSLYARRDPWVNLLRGSHAVFVAAVAGAEAITMVPWDRPLGVPDASGQRVAQTSQAVLAHEAHLGRVVDPAGGSWYLESLTDGLARAAWKRFQAWEKDGGLGARLSRGELPPEVRLAREARAAEVAKRRVGLVGVSVYPNPDEVLPERADAPFQVPWRDASPWEALRDAAEAAPSRPHVFLAALGPLVRHKARVDFAAQLFDAAGFQVTTGPGASEAVGLAAGFRASGAGAAVLCGHDDDYFALGEAAVRALRDAGADHVVLAGRPGALEPALRQAGLTDAIWLGADVLAVVRRVMEVSP